MEPRSHEDRDELLMRCTLHCATARAAAGIAAELRETRNARVAIEHPAPGTGWPSGWVVLLTTTPLLPGAEELLRAQDSLEDLVSRWPGSSLLGWRLLRAVDERSTPRAAAGFSQRDTVVASLLRRPEVKAA